MIVRKGISSDMPSVLALIKELAIFEKEPDAVEVTVDDLIRDGFSENPLFNCFVAEEVIESREENQSTQIIGIALYYYRYSTWKGKTIHLEDLIVKEDKRGNGVGKALYSEVIRQGKLDKVRRIEWAVLDWNIPAINFYKKTGANVLIDWHLVQMDENGIDAFLDSNL